MSRKNAAGSSITDLIGMTPAMLPGNEAVVLEYPELGAETICAGEIVSMSGAFGSRLGITPCGTDASGYGIWGVACDPSSGAISSFMGVWLASSDVIWEVNVNDATTSAAAQTGALVLGKKYGLTTLSGMTYCDLTKTSAIPVSCTVVGYNKQDDIPSFYGRVYVKLMGDKIQTLVSCSGIHNILP
jgi:hypothetical protein